MNGICTHSFYEKMHAFDYIVPIAKTILNVQDHFEDIHGSFDFDFLLDVIKAEQPDYYECAFSYLTKRGSNSNYYSADFLFSVDVFSDYC